MSSAKLLEKCPDDMAFFNEFFDKGLLARLKALVEAEFAHVSYTEAVEKLLEHKDEFEYPVFWGCDLQTRAREVSHRENLSKAGLRHRLSQGNQGLLYAPQ